MSGVSMKAFQKPAEFRRPVGKDSRAAPAVLPIRPDAQLQMQRKAACACGGGCPRCAQEHTPEIIQTKLQISAPGDLYELEADAVAEQVMRMPDTAVQRQSDGRTDVSGAHRFEEHLSIQRDANGKVGRGAVASGVTGSLGLGASLDASTRDYFEPRFGYNFSGVRVHTGDAAAEAARAVQARAYTVGPDIVFGGGEYQPTSGEGRWLIAHELAHVVQQSGVAENHPAGRRAQPAISLAQVAQPHSANAQIYRTVTTAPTTFKTYAQLRAMRVPAFLSYIEQQADWFSNPALTDDQRARIRTILLFINEDVAAYFTYVGIWYFDLLLNDVTAAESEKNAQALQAYASAASARHVPFPVSNEPVAVTTAIDRGKDMVKLRRSFHDFVLHDALNETQFLSLRNHPGYVDDVIQYHDNAQQQPIFQAEDGMDFYSFIRHNQATSRSPLHYESTSLLNKIRNFHRFQKPALDRLVTNYGDRSHTKPVTLILHAALDHNGAFHRDPNLTAVITNNHMLTLMIEGFEHMSQYQSLMNQLATDYGQRHGTNFLIDQVMFAGHGDAQLMQLAGAIQEDPSRAGHIQEINEWLNVAPGGDAATRSLLQDVLNFMANPANGTGGMSPRNRVVFNACLTGSNSVSTAVSSGDPAAASTAIGSFIAGHPSLSTFLHNMADPSLRSIGSRASFGQVALINAADQLDIISAGDPSLTAASPLTYAEHGTEPTGALRSALEAWSHDRPGTIAALQRRVLLAATSWDTKLIKKAYQIIVDPVNGYQNNGEKFRLVALGVERIAEMESESNAQVGNGNFRFFQQIVSDGNDSDNSSLLNALTTTSEWTNSATQLALLQVWMKLDAAKQANFMTKLASLNCNFSVRFVDINFLASQALMSPLLAGAASAQAKLRLALIGILGTNDNPDARAHLMGLLAGAQHFPAALNLTTALGGAATEAALLIKLGVASAPTAQQVANIHLGGSGTNTVFVQRLNVTGIVSSPFGADVHPQPDDTTPVTTTLNYQDHVPIIGRTGDWYAIQFSSGGATPAAAFVSRWEVDLLPA